jgi:hypothetical protein
MSQFSTLRSSEWLLTSIFLLVFAALFVLAKVQSSFCPLPPVSEHPARRSLKVTIEGCVAKPGDYLVEKGTPLGEVLRKAAPRRFADLKKVDLQTRVETPLQIQIEELKELTVFLQGSLGAPHSLKVPLRTRVCDLKKYLSEQALIDPSFFKSKRMLKEGEILTLPSKNQL